MRAMVAWAVCAGVLAGSAALVVVFPPASGSAPQWHATTAWRPSAVSASGSAQGPRHAWFGATPSSPDARDLADWVAETGDNAGAAFVVVDKRLATLFVFDADARLRASTTVLLGAAIGDDSVPGIGNRPIDQVLPQERTTPAGRFVGERGHDTHGKDVVWLDYDAGFSIHRVITSQASEHRLERLASPVLADKRISWGCINVPAAFYETYIRPAFAIRRAAVYVLPEVRSARQVFGLVDAVVAAQGRADVN